jgi:molecular chaperone DnaK (HSP70)
LGFQCKNKVKKNQKKTEIFLGFFLQQKIKKKKLENFLCFQILKWTSSVKMNYKLILISNLSQFSDGVKVEPLVIITDYLKFLVDFAVKKVSEEEKIEIEQIRWVLTIPACWTDREKILMKKAAFESGMISKMDEDSERFLFALEPEAAGLYSCITLKKNKKLNEFMNEGENFMIIDAGGGTLDITAHQVLKDGFLKELCIGQGASVGSSIFLFKKLKIQRSF